MKAKYSTSNNKLALLVEDAQESTQTVSSNLSKNFTDKVVDSFTYREFIKIANLDKERVGAPFSAKVVSVADAEKGIYVLGDETGRIEAIIKKKRTRSGITFPLPTD